MQMDSKYQHSSIQLYIMGPKSSSGSIEAAAKGIELSGVATGETPETKKHNEEDVVEDKEDDIGGGNDGQDCILATSIPKEKLSDWEARRYGSMAARLLRDVKIT